MKKNIIYFLLLATVLITASCEEESSRKRFYNSTFINLYELDITYFDETGKSIVYEEKNVGDFLNREYLLVLKEYPFFTITAWTAPIYLPVERHRVESVKISINANKNIKRDQIAIY